MMRIESELSMIGLMIVRSEDCEKYFSMLALDDFQNVDCKEIFDTMQRMRLEHRPIDLATLCDYNPRLNAINVIEIARNAGSIAFADGYFDAIKESTARRRLSEMGKKLLEDSRSEKPVTEIVSEARQELSEMSVTQGEDTSMRSVIMTLNDGMFVKQDAGIRMGMDAFDGYIHGYKSGRMYTVGARPAVGKTVFGMVSAIRAASIGKPVLYINREMEKDDMAKRMIAHLSSINLSHMETGTMSDMETEEFMEVMPLLDRMNIQIANKPRTPEEIRAKVQSMSEAGGVGLVVVDYLQRIKSERRYKNRDEEIGDITWQLKNIAMDFKVPLILLSQLNRDVRNERPNMSNLRESGNIEQDSDVVILLHRPDIGDVPVKQIEAVNEVRKRGGVFMEMIVDKNRYGSTGIVPVVFWGANMRYTGL